MNDVYRIRATESRDIPDLYRVRSATRQNAISKQQLVEWGITPQSIADGLESGLFVGFVCEHEERVVGFCSGDTGTGEVIVLAVLPEHEGKGIGLSMLTQVVQELSERGHSRVWLACSSDPNSRSHGFYRRNGWIATGERLENGDEILEKHQVHIRTRNTSCSSRRSPLEASPT